MYLSQGFSHQVCSIIEDVQYRSVIVQVNKTRFEPVTSMSKPWRLYISRLCSGWVRV